MEIRVKTMSEAHLKACAEIFDNGIDITTEDDELTFEYPEPLIIRIEYPNMNPKISKFNNLNNKSINEYVKQFMTITPSDFAYTYGNRMMDYPIATEDEDLEGYYPTLTDSGYGEGMNQIEWVVDTLIKNPESRRAVVMLRCPEIDCESNNPPCLTIIQFMIRDGVLNTTAYFRSNDMLSAYGNNVYALYKLTNCISKRTNCEVGSIMTISNSAHIYWKRDAEELKKFKLELMKNSYGM